MPKRTTLTQISTTWQLLSGPEACLVKLGICTKKKNATLQNLPYPSPLPNV